MHYKKVQRGYIVYNTEKPKAHSHIKKPMTCIKLIKMLENGILPNSGYLVESARRLLKDSEFAKLRAKKRKQKYVNVQRGVS